MSQITPKYFYFDKRLGRIVVSTDLLAKVLRVPNGHVTGAVFEYLTRFKRGQRAIICLMRWIAPHSILCFLF